MLFTQLFEYEIFRAEKYSHPFIQLFEDGRSMKPNKSNDFNDRLNGQMVIVIDFHFEKRKSMTNKTNVLITHGGDEKKNNNIHSYL